MLILINNPLLSNKIFITIFVLALIASLRQKKDQELFPLALTQELKGLAILAVVFSHVGYFLSSDHRFLFPLSIMAGVGVNLFLFLSGYGLTISTLKKELSVGMFYKKRLLKLFTPFWIVIFAFFLFDFLWLHIYYDWSYVAWSFVGFFPRADLFLDINSPFWFLTPLLFYYLIFPFIFLKKRPWITAIIVYLASHFAIQSTLPVSIDVLHLYQLHLLAFPLGIAFASLFFEPYYFSRFAPDKVKSFLYNLKKPIWLKIILNKVKKPNIFHRNLKVFSSFTYYLILIALLVLISYTAYHSGVGEQPNKEQAINLITMSAIIFFFIMKKLEIRLLYLFGFYSYEIYLIHWPLMSRYDLFFKWFPGWLAMILYLGLFLLFAWLLKKIPDQINKIKISNSIFSKYFFYPLFFLNKFYRNLKK
jgi:peptidoglycan/LPS O-acetylase OafA/YrhL